MGETRAVIGWPGSSSALMGELESQIWEMVLGNRRDHLVLATSLHHSADNVLADIWWKLDSAHHLYSPLWACGR